MTILKFSMVTVICDVIVIYYTIGHRLCTVNFACVYFNLRKISNMVWLYYGTIALQKRIISSCRNYCDIIQYNETNIDMNIPHNFYMGATTIIYCNCYHKFSPCTYEYLFIKMLFYNDFDTEI